MGCSASAGAAGKAGKGKIETTQVERIESATWATKTDSDHATPQRFLNRPEEADNSSSSMADPTFLTKTGKSGGPPTSGGARSAGQAGKDRASSPTIEIEDAEDEIEIICEGTGPSIQKQQSGKQEAVVANGQEAPTEDEAPRAEQPQTTSQGKSGSDGKRDWPWANKPAAPVQRQMTAVEQMQSQRQKEEAAKLAEQRKRFDNQRYQREQDSAQSPKFSGPFPEASTDRSPKNDPGAAMVLGLNISAHEMDTSEVQDIGQGLPGGIEDEMPRGDAVTAAADLAAKNRAKHECFDHAEEMLMQEILESVDV